MRGQGHRPGLPSLQVAVDVKQHLKKKNAVFVHRASSNYTGIPEEVFCSFVFVCGGRKGGTKISLNMTKQTQTLVFAFRADMMRPFWLTGR